MNSEIVSDLYIYAEIAVALAGFAAIVGSIERRGDEKLSTLRKSSYHSLLSSALIIILLAFFPIMLKYWTEDWTLILRLCFGLVLVLAILSAYTYFASSRVDQTKYVDASALEKVMAKSEYVFLTVGQCLNLAALACVLGFLEDYYQQIYFSILTYYLVLSATGFMILVTQRREDEST